MVIQLPGSQLISLLAQLTDERHHQSTPEAAILPPRGPCQSGCGHHLTKMADLQDRFVPPRLDL